MQSGFPFVKRISGQSLLNLGESGKADYITRVFNDAYRVCSCKPVVCSERG
jgi:hypothetical protein